MRRTLKLWMRVAASMVIAAYTTATAWAQNATAPEYALKTAYLYHFLEFTEWPAAHAYDSTLQVCVDKDNPWRGSLFALNERMVHNKIIKIANLSSDRYAQCEVLIVKLSDLIQLTAITTSLPALIVSDDPAVAIDSVMINLQIDNDHIAFAVNNTSARAVGIKISSKLLRLANKVR